MVKPETDFVDIRSKNKPLLERVHEKQKTKNKDAKPKESHKGHLFIDSQDIVMKSSIRTDMTSLKVTETYCSKRSMRFSRCPCVALPGLSRYTYTSKV